MLILAKAEPRWITLIEGTKEAPSGVRVKVAPITRRIRQKAARAAARAAEGVTRDPDAVLSDVDLEQLFDAGEAGSRELIRLALLDQPEPEWEGVLGTDGHPVPLTAEHLEVALSIDAFFDAADRLIVQPAAEVAREGNASAASPGGTGGAATQGRATASSAAKPKRKAAAKRAPTPKTRSKAKPARKPGRS